MRKDGRACLALLLILLALGSAAAPEISDGAACLALADEASGADCGVGVVAAGKRATGAVVAALHGARGGRDGADPLAAVADAHRQRVRRAGARAAPAGTRVPLPPPPPPHAPPAERRVRLQNRDYRTEQNRTAALVAESAQPCGGVLEESRAMRIGSLKWFRTQRNGRYLA